MPTQLVLDIPNDGPQGIHEWFKEERERPGTTARAVAALEAVGLSPKIYGMSEGGEEPGHDGPLPLATTLGFMQTAMNEGVSFETAANMLAMSLATLFTLPPSLFGLRPERITAVHLRAIATRLDWNWVPFNWRKGWTCS